MKIPPKEKSHAITDFIGENESSINRSNNLFKRLKIKSKSGPELDVVYGNPLERVIAFLIDVGLILTAFLISETFLFSYDYANSKYNIYRFIIGFFVWIFYNGILESSHFQATFGEMILKLEVIDLFGKRIDGIRASFRALTFLIFLLPLGIGIWRILKDQKKQGWHDLVSGCYIIKTY